MTLYLSKDWQDLLAFARIEKESGDLEPWAELLGHIGAQLDNERSLWLVSLYNTYDSMSSAWGVYRRWPDPQLWATDPKREEARNFPCMQERRNLHGGRVNKRLASYIDQLGSDLQYDWLAGAVDWDGNQGNNFLYMMSHVRKIWGVGRQAAFEWAEFLGKANDFPLQAPTAVLWESSGPRESLQTLYRDPNPDKHTLDDYATDCRNWLAENGVELLWEDFETVICDFKVMQRGRYYPGRHLAALREEIEQIPGDDGNALLSIFRHMLPKPWRDIPPGIDKTLMPVYRDTGRIVTGVNAV